MGGFPLADHVGYAIFAGTIKGRNQLYRTHEAGKTAADWFTLWQDIDRSLGKPISPALSPPGAGQPLVTDK